MHQKGFAHLLLILVLGIGLLGGIYAYQKGYIKTTPSTQNNIESTNSPAPTVASMTGWSTYTNSELGISYEYPNNWRHHVYPTDPLSSWKQSGGMDLGNQLIINWIYFENSKNLTLQDLDKEITKKDKENNVGILTESLTPEDYEIVQLKNGYQTYYEKEAFCEPTICQQYTIVRPGKVLLIIIFADENNQFSQGIQHFLDTFKFTK